MPVTFISVGDSNQDGVDGFLDIINALIAETTPPTVLTTSYGFNEPDLSTSIAKYAIFWPCVVLNVLIT